MEFKRPESIEYPKVWHRFEKTTKNGDTIKFRVQDATEEHYDGIFEIMKNDFDKYEPWRLEIGMADDAKSHDIVINFAKKIVLPQKLTLVCLLDDVNEPKPTIVGYNFLWILNKNRPENYLEFDQAESTKKLLMMYDIFDKLCPDVFEKYNVESYVDAIGLCVNSHYRGMNIAVEILRARIPLCKAIGIKISATTFTSTLSQKAAKKAGFESDVSISYDVLRKITGYEFKDCINCEMMTLKID